MDTKARLQRYAALRKENENRLERLARLKAQAEMPALKDPDGSQHSGSSGERMARAVEQYVAYEEEIRPLIEANRQEINEITVAVNSLKNPMEREVLRLRYMDNEHYQLLSWREVASRIYGSDERRCLDAAIRLHRDAVKNIESLRIFDNN